MENIIEIKSLSKSYKDVKAVDNLSLSVKKGEIFALLGVNGAGKTTTLRMLTLITKPDSGDALINGYSILKSPALVKDIIAVSPQETAVAPNLSVKENLELMCGVHGFNRTKTRQKVSELSEQFELNGILNKKAGKLSGGWQRRLSIAMALITEPLVLTLDEPTVGVDVLARSDIWEIIRALKGKTTVILTTHYMEEAQTLCERIAIMKNGSLLALGTADELKQMAGEENFEQAFIKIVKGDKKL